ncbi:MAG: ParB/RepB/Spo0J family partition protein [Kiritimatiellia bacterium]
MPDNPFLKKSTGSKPPTRAAIRALQKKGGLGGGLGGLGHVGRGLDNLTTPPAVATVAPAASAVPAVQPEDVVIHVPPIEIARSPYQPRTEFRQETLQELADSIRTNGIIQPLTCRRRPDGKIELICGERRLRAALLADMKLVPVVLKDVDDATACTMTVTENAQRDDLNPIDEAEGYRVLAEKFNYTQAEVADRVGKSRTSVTHALRLLDLPDDVQDLLRKRAISTGHAKVLLSLDNAAEIRRLALECAPKPDPRTGNPVGGLTVRELERQIAREHAPTVEKKAATPDMPDSYVRALAEEIHKTLGCAVRLKSAMKHANGKRTKGVLEIDFLDNDDLDRVLRIMGVRMD